MDSRTAGNDRSERVLRWTAAALGAALLAAAMACDGEREGDAMEGVAYVEVGAQTVVATPAQTRMPVATETATPSPAADTAETGVPPDAGATEDEVPPPETAAPPKAPWEHYDEGIAAWKGGENTAAETHLREWVAYAPDHVKGRVNLARVLIEIGRPHEAKEHATLAADLDPSSVAAKRVLARALAEAGDPTAALAMYEEALWLDPDDRWSLNNMGYLLILRGRHDEAVGPLALATRVDSANAMFHSNLGAALEGAGYPAAALEAFAEAVAIDPGHTRAAASVARLSELVPEDAAPEVDIGLLADDYRKGLMGVPGEEDPGLVEHPWRGYSGQGD